MKIKFLIPSNMSTSMNGDIDKYFRPIAVKYSHFNFNVLLHEQKIYFVSHQDVGKSYQNIMDDLNAVLLERYG